MQVVSLSVNIKLYFQISNPPARTALRAVYVSSGAVHILAPIHNHPDAIYVIIMNYGAGEGVNLKKLMES